MPNTQPLAPTKSAEETRQRYAQYFSESDNDEVSMDTFFQLLVAEMSNQDPMQPMSNTEFISQMASFTSLQAQKDALYYQNANYAQSLVGKTVTVATVSGTDLLTDSGVVTSMNLSNGEFNVKVNGSSYALANVMEVMPSNNPLTATAADGFYAASMIGKYVTAVSQDATGTAVVDAGIVSQVELNGNNVSVIINGIAYPIGDVTRIEAGEPYNHADSEDSDE
jgi:flagellar basal-body rod modification protein FlgD